MALYPEARIELLPESATQARMTPTAIIDHSNAAESDDLFGWWNSPGQELESHFQINWEGVVYQYMDTETTADANVAANSFAVSIEVANSPTLQGFLNVGDRAGVQRQFDADGYSPEQRVSLIRLHSWLHGEHCTIPRKVCTDGRNGVGWHEKFPSWTTPGHHCPGNTRVQALVDDIYPASFAGPSPSAPVQEDDMNRADTIALLRAPEFSQAETRKQVAALAKQVADQNKAILLLLKALNDTVNKPS